MKFTGMKAPYSIVNGQPITLHDDGGNVIGKLHVQGTNEEEVGKIADRVVAALDVYEVVEDAVSNEIRFGNLEWYAMKWQSFARRVLK